jgi:hypothetical protein
MSTCRLLSKIFIEFDKTMSCKVPAKRNICGPCTTRTFDFSVAQSNSPLRKKIREKARTIQQQVCHYYSTCLPLCPFQKHRSSQVKSEEQACERIQPRICLEFENGNYAQKISFLLEIVDTGGFLILLADCISTGLVLAQGTLNLNFARTCASESLTI